MKIVRNRWVCGVVVWLAMAAVSKAQAPAPADSVPSLGAVFKQVPRDLWKFVSWDTALVLGAGGGAAAVGHIWDDDLAHKVETSPSLNNALEPGHTYGAFSFQFAIGIGMYGTGWLADKGRLAQAGGDVMRAQLLGQAYTQALKFTVGRERPDGSNSQSFPSGHSASAFATASVLQRYYGWWVGVPATIAAGYVATARVHDNKHYLSDVIFGGAMGIAAQRTVMLRSGRYGFALNAMGLPGGGGVNVSVLAR